MGESRQELLAWMNGLLQLNLTKIEQCGTGAPLCQIYDSIFLDVPMTKVKFNVNTEYAYIQNFKVLQNTFTKHQVDRPVPVQALVKCKMQDNLEFLQWTKRFWDQYYHGGEYDPVARRKGSGAPPTTAATRSVNSAAATRAPRGSTPTAGAARAARPAASSAQTVALTQENNTLKETVVGLERERDFYFSKLRDIELLLQSAVEADPEIENHDDGLVKQVQAILYSTEEGFEIPAEAEGEIEAHEDLETF
ncbi:hypothetical protein L228DRAFT_246279 [Xylona heveae TC161]|uniref:Uncharacterized protein n=1 Tax=Xylona heveae (strain CBS 132557 / TC161) TaxID=1328760 RepID=A0A165HH69_XYLHT|nr:hypothetical protein L228DRAFT_246279 [Xylona heveae TC161]KZF23509.1 hypothetical protein L228DRAFT_246279 [Xylona heveae TC161]